MSGNPYFRFNLSCVLLIVAVDERVGFFPLCFSTHCSGKVIVTVCAHKDAMCCHQDADYQHK